MAAVSKKFVAATMPERAAVSAAALSEQVVAMRVVAAETVVVVVVLAATAVYVVPSSPEPRTSLSRGPKNWLRDSHLGWAMECRSQPDPRSQLWIREPMDLLLNLSMVDLAPGCRRAEAASES